MRARFFALGIFALACASSAPEPRPTPAPVRRSAPREIAFPPTGPVELRPESAPAEGTLYQLVMKTEGRTEITTNGPGSHESQMVDEKTSLEIDYRQMPVATPTADDLASSLVLEALMRRLRIAPPGKEQLLEIGDDRLRTSVDDKVGTDLRGAQPKEDLTPREVIGKSFALIVLDVQGNPKGVTLHGVPPAKKMLSTLPLRESLSFVQIAYPDHPVSPGDTWHAKRYFPNPIGKLGLGVDIEVRLVGFDRMGDAPCAHVSLRSKSEATNVPSDSGVMFDEVHDQLSGDAWLDLATGQVAQARIEDVAAVAYSKTALAVPTRVRMRYEGRSELQRLAELPPSANWADGAKRFSAVDENRPNAPTGGAKGRY
ncbi:MAG: hypothetical protein ACHQ6T_16475 [Myxococcota bacterium]